MTITRKTAETDVTVSLVYGGKSEIDTGVGFLDHMLGLFAHHGGFGLAALCKGDTNVDAHHSTEDVGICLGKALDGLLGERRGITRYGHAVIPMDEALVSCSLDICGRGFLAFDLGRLNEKVGDFDTELVKEFFAALCRESRVTLHITRQAGENTHHVIEAAFKAFGRALKQAAAKSDTPDDVPSTKGVI